MNQKWGLFSFFCMLSLLSFSQSLEQEARSKIDELTILINTAESEGIDTTQEKMGIRVAEIFLVCATWDENNKAINEAEFAAHNSIPVGVPKPTPAELAERIPEYEREEIIKVLDQNIRKLTQLINKEETRKPTPEIQWDQLEINGTRITQNGTPVFVNDWNFKNNSLDSFSLTEYFGDLGGDFFDLRMLRKSSDGTLVTNPNLVNWLTNNLKTGNFGSPFLGQSLIPDFILTDYPDIQEGRSEFTAFDIDHPQAKVMHEVLFKDLVPIYKGKNISKLGYMLTNEPHWNTVGTWDIVDITPYTKAKFVDWLRVKHTSLATMNALWNSSFNSFEAAANSIVTPIPADLRGNPKWYDFMRFNQNRVTNWFTFLHDEIKKYDEEAKTHIKLIPGQWSGNARDNGLDFESLTSLTEIIGNDASMKNSLLWGTLPWQDFYTMEWLGATMSYDFMHSVNPTAINYNSEAHFLTNVRFTDSFLEPSYARASHWLATIHGLDATTNWVWLRDTDGSITKPNFVHAGTVAQQPSIFNEIQATIMDLNSYGEEISLLQELENPIRIFYSETSAINKDNHMSQISNLYESIYFEGYRLGFATENIIKNQNNRDWEFIVIGNTEYVTIDELNTLQQYLNDGGTILLDPLSLKKDEYGRNHTTTLTPAEGTIINVSANGIKDRTITLVKERGHNLVVEVTETNTAVADFKGVAHRSIKTTESKNILSLVNLGLTDATINLSLQGDDTDIEIIDLLKGTTLTNNFVIASEQVLLLEVKKNTLSTDEHTDTSSFPIKIYPNPFNDKIVVHTNSEKDVGFKIYSLQGAQLTQGILSGNNQKISLDYLSNGVYFLEILEEQRNLKKVLKIIKK